MAIAILLIAIGILVPDLYIWNEYIRNLGLIWSVIYWAPSAAFTVLTVMAMCWRRFDAGVMNILTALLLGVGLPKALFALVAWLGATSGGLWRYAEPLGFYGGLAVAAFVMTLSFFGLFYGWRIVRIKRVELEFDGLPEAFDGYRIAHITDFHIGTYLRSADTVGKIVDAINGTRPDVVAFTGDLVNLSPDEVTLFVPELSRLSAPDGVLSILGNHDYCNYVRYGTSDGRSLAQRRLEELQHRAGWRLLKNENVVIHRGDEEIAIVGVENDGKPPFPARGDLRKAMRGLPQGIFTVLMSHDPSHWRRRVLPETEIPLTLSGHTHGMQFRIGKFSPSQFAYSEWGGLYEENGRMLYVSTGIGSNLTFRFGAWPEIVLITLRKRRRE